MSQGPTPKAAIRALLDKRGAGKTLCPSEAARLLAGQTGDWRAEMDRVHKAADAMLEAGEIHLSWKGQDMKKRRGPYRIARR